jgi:hypothetical protein
MEGVRNEYKSLVENCRTDIGEDGRIMLNWVLRCRIGSC